MGRYIFFVKMEIKINLANCEFCVISMSLFLIINFIIVGIMLDREKKNVLRRVVALLDKKKITVSDLQAYIALQEKISMQMKQPDAPELFYIDGKACGVKVGEIFIWGHYLKGDFSYDGARISGWLVKQTASGLVLPVVWRQVSRYLEAVNFILEENDMEPLVDEFVWTCAEMGNRVYLYNPVSDKDIPVTQDTKAKCRPVFLKK